MSDIQTLEHFFHLMNANGASRAYHQSLQSGLLPALQTGPLALSALAQQCHLQERPTQLLLEVLLPLGLVTFTNPTYQLTPLAQTLLASSYRTLGDAYWSHLPQFLATGTPIAQMDNLAHSEAHYAAQAEPLAWMSAPAAQLAAKLLAPRLPPNAHLLDLGSGSAIWSLTLARALPNATITAIDWPAVLQVAQKFAARMGLADRLHIQPGNYHDLPLQPQSFDLILAANVFHLEPESALRTLLPRLHAALKPTAHLAIIDILPGTTPDNAPGTPQDNRGDLNRALYTLGLALRTTQAAPHSPETLHRLLTQSAFHNIQSLPLPITPHALGIILAQRT